jgi:hypothetical protein
MTLLEQLADECFRAGKPLEELVAELVEKKYNSTLSKAKTAIREGVDFQSVVDSLTYRDSLPSAIATGLVLEAQSQVRKEIADENQLRKATETAIALYKNGNRFSDVVSALKRFAPGIAEKVAKDNQQYYRA